MSHARFFVLVSFFATAAQAQTVAPQLAPPPASVTVPTQPPPQQPALQAVPVPAPKPAPPVAAPFGGLYDVISGHSGAANCTPGLTPFNASACK